MLQIQHSQFNSPCKYTVMNPGSQMFFADLSRFRLILLDTSVLRQSFPHYGRACDCTAKQGGSSRQSLPPSEPAYKHSGRWDRMPPAGRWAAGRNWDWQRSSTPRGPDPSRLRAVSWHFQAARWCSVFGYRPADRGFLMARMLLSGTSSTGNPAGRRFAADPKAPLNKTGKKKPVHPEDRSGKTGRIFFVMVEAAGVEPASENIPH